VDATFLHAAHQVRETLDGLRWASWLAIGLGVGAVVVAWGRIAAWVRSPEATIPRLVAWGVDGTGVYFQVARPGAAAWAAEGPGGESLALTAAEDGLLRAPAPEWRPVAILSSEGHRLPL
jgi:hypothetical protein